MKNTRAIVIGLIAILGTAIFSCAVSRVFFTASGPWLRRTARHSPGPCSSYCSTICDRLCRRATICWSYAYINSFILTIASVTGLVIFASMVAYVWQRRPVGSSPVISIWCWPA